jgi:hypothetical protein
MFVESSSVGRRHQASRISARLVTLAAALLLCLSFFSPWARSAFAYSPALSLVEVRLHPNHLELTIGLDLESAWLAMGESTKSAPDVAGSIPRLEKDAAKFCQLSAGGQVLVPRETSVDFRPAEGDVVLHVIFAVPSTWPLHFEATYLKRLPDFHETRLILRNLANKAIRVEMLTGVKASAELQLPSDTSTSQRPPNMSAANAAPALLAPQPSASFWNLVRYGLKYMLTSYNCIVFLLALLVVCRRFSSMVAVIIAFTVGYSLTLALATLGVVTAPSKVTGSLIAATLVLVGLENLLRREEPKARWLPTFAFGLIHGFGFATVLRQAQLDTAASSLTRSILPFNLGVELGQIVVLTILVSALWKLRSRPSLVRYGVPAISILALLLGGYGLFTSAALL